MTGAAAAPDALTRDGWWAALLSCPAYLRCPEIALRDCLAALAALGERCPRKAIALMCQHAQEEVETSGPAPGIGPMTEDAAFWVACASAREREVYLLALIRAMEREVVTPRARKRLLVAMWHDLPDADRVAFLRRVDPAGRFARREVAHV